jgi:hypothetical protein
LVVVGEPCGDLLFFQPVERQALLDAAALLSARGPHRVTLERQVFDVGFLEGNADTIAPPALVGGRKTSA